MDEIYRFLAAKYGYNPREIADMTPTQQWMLINVQGGVDRRTGRETITFKNMDDYNTWRASRNS